MKKLLLFPSLSLSLSLSFIRSLARFHSNYYSLPVTKAKVFSQRIYEESFMLEDVFFFTFSWRFLVYIHTRNTRTTTFQNLNALLLLPKVNGKYSWCSFVYSTSLLLSSLSLWCDGYQATYTRTHTHTHAYRYVVAIRAIRVCKPNTQDETETKGKNSEAVKK